MDDPNPPGYGHPPSSGYGHPPSSGSGHPQSQTGRGELLPGSDGSKRHQLDQRRLRELYPVIPEGLISVEMHILHPVRYMPPHGAYFDLLDKERVQFPYPVKKSCKVCMGKKHVYNDQPCYEMCLACGQTHPLVPCPKIYNTVRSWKRLGWWLGGKFPIPSSTQVKPNEDEVVILKANGYIADDWVFDSSQVPAFIDGTWNKERTGPDVIPSMSVAYPRTSSSLAARMSYGDDKNPYGRNTYRDDNPYGRNTYRDDSPYGRNTYRDDNPYGRNTYRDDNSYGHNTYRDDGRPRSPRRDIYDQQSRTSYRSPSRSWGRDDRRSRRSRSPSRGRDSPTRYRDRSPGQKGVFDDHFDRLIKGVVRDLLTKQPRSSPPRSPPRHSHLDQRAPPAPSNPRQNQQAHSALPRARRDDTPRSVNRRARPAPSRGTDLGVSDPMDWQPHTQSHGSDLNAQNRQGRPELAKLTNYKVPGTEGQGRPELRKLGNYKVPGTEGQGRPELRKLGNYKVPGPEGQEPPTQGDVDSSATNDGYKYDIDF